MAEKRMFAKSIVLTDAFLDMPMSARCLYFTLGMLADDDGFVGSPRSIMRQCGASQDDMNMLVTKRYVLVFDSGVIVIKHWRINNYLQNDRYKKTTYLDELSTLKLDKKGAYTELEKPMYTECIQNVYTDKNSIDKSRIDKNSEEPKRKRFVPPTIEEVKAYIAEKGYHVDAEFFWNYYDKGQWKRKDGTPVLNWKQTLVTWEKKDSEKPAQKKNQVVTAAEYKPPKMSDTDIWKLVDKI